MYIGCTLTHTTEKTEILKVRKGGSEMKIIEKVKQTLEIVAAPLAAVLLVWTGLDYSAYVVGGIAVVLSILQYAEMFIPAKK
jgi:hypothetical protein